MAELLERDVVTEGECLVGSECAVVAIGVGCGGRRAGMQIQGVGKGGTSSTETCALEGERGGYRARVW